MPLYLYQKKIGFCLGFSFCLQINTLGFIPNNYVGNNRNIISGDMQLLGSEHAH